MSPDEKKKSIYGDLNQGTMLNSKKKQMNPTRHQFQTPDKRAADQWEYNFKYS